MFTSRSFFRIFSNRHKPIKQIPHITKPILLPEEVCEKSFPALIHLFIHPDTPIGSSFFIAPDGTAITLSEFIRPNTPIFGQTLSGSFYPIKVQHSSPSLNLSLIKLEVPTKVPFLPLADSSKLSRGQKIISFGSMNKTPFSTFKPSYIESFTHTTLNSTNTLQDQDLSKYKSEQLLVLAQGKLENNFLGGPLVSFKAEANGINVGNINGAGGLGPDFAVFVPSNTILKFIEDENFTLDFNLNLGLGIEELHKGLLVVKLEPKSLASESGLAVADIITSVDNVEIQGYSDFVNSLSAHNLKTIPITVKRVKELVNLELLLK